MARVSTATTGPKRRCAQRLRVVQEKIARLAEFPGFAGFLFHDVEPDPALLDERVLEAAETKLAATEPWTTDAIERSLKELCEELGEKPRTVYLPIRVAVTGSQRVARPLREPGASRQDGSLDRCYGPKLPVAVTSLSNHLIGTELGPSQWIDVTQERIDAFADATDDHQWIHVDGERAASGPVRIDDRARLSDALARRPDARRGAAAVTPQAARWS